MNDHFLKKKIRKETLENYNFFFFLMTFAETRFYVYDKALTSNESIAFRAFRILYT